MRAQILPGLCAQCWSTRAQAAEAQRSANALTLASSAVQSVVRKVAKDPTLENEQAMVITRMFEQQGSAMRASLRGEGVQASELREKAPFRR